MKSYILKEGYLNDDFLKLPDENKIFKGNYIAIIYKYSYLNAWGNRLEKIKFRSEKQLLKFLRKNYSAFFIENFI